MTIVREASCRCGQLSVTCEGEPVRVSVCHCSNCQQRSGAPFAEQARWPVDRVVTEGDSKVWTNVSDAGNAAHFHFCPTCGSTVRYRAEAMPDVIAIPVGLFRDPDFPPPRFSVWEERKHPWVEIAGEEVEHSA